MRQTGVIRKDRKAVSPVIATILMVAITVVLAAVLYVMVSGLSIGPGAAPDAIGVSVGQSPAGLDWVLTLVNVPAAMANSTVSLAISDPSGMTLLAATTLDDLSGVDETYSPITTGTALAGGDRILLSVSVYPAGSIYQLWDAGGILAAGTLG